MSCLDAADWRFFAGGLFGISVSNVHNFGDFSVVVVVVLFVAAAVFWDGGSDA